MILTIDFETRCAEDITKAGVWKYAEHPTCTPICLAVGVDDKEPRIWLNDWVKNILIAYEGSRSGRALDFWSLVISTEELLDLIQKADMIEAHNAEFEYAMWKKHMPGELPREKLYCTAARAAMCALPRALDYVCRVLNLKQQKDKDGGKIMKQVSLPKVQKDGSLKWDNDPEKLLTTCLYCMQDVRAERELSKSIPHLPTGEREAWLLDQEINERGITVDGVSARNILKMVAEYKEALLDEFKEIVKDPEISSPSQVQKFMDWCAAQGVNLDNMQAEHVDSIIKTLEGGPVKRALQIRRSVGKTSNAKYDAMLDRQQADGRARSLFMYHGAGTGRWSGAGIQPQNLPSRKVFKKPEMVLEELSLGRSWEYLDMFYGDPMWLASSCIRSCLTASEGNLLYAADLKSIEGRGLAWLADEKYVVEAYFQGVDTYKVAAGKIYGKDPLEIQDESFERQIGKVVELACIAAGQLVTTDRGLVPIEEVEPSDLVFDGVDFVKHDGVVYRGVRLVMEYDGLTATPDHIVFRDDGTTGTFDRIWSENTYTDELILRRNHVYDILNCGPRNRFVVSGKLVHNCGYQGGIGALSRMADSYGIQLPPPDETQNIIKTWRASRPQTVRLWKEMEAAAMMAIRNPGQIVQCGKVAFKVARGALMMRLPSGRCLYYQKPSIGMKKVPWMDEEGNPKQVPSILFWGVDSTTKQWTQQTTYGGCLVENAVQAICRDILVHGMMQIEKSGKYKIILHVHDEAVAESSCGDWNEYAGLMTQTPSWAAGLPVVATGWVGKRYKK